MCLLSNCDFIILFGKDKVIHTFDGYFQIWWTSTSNTKMQLQTMMRTMKRKSMNKMETTN